MKIVYLDCQMGISGDMFAGAMLGLVKEPEQIIDLLNKLGKGLFQVEVKTAINNYMQGNKFNVMIKKDEGHVHATYDFLYQRLESLGLDPAIEARIKAMYLDILKVESEAHGIEVKKVHLHELGQIDALADLAAAALLIEEVKADKYICSTIKTGFGKVKTDHGFLSVPAPATSKLLKGLEIEHGEVEAELVTPTGAAILKHLQISQGKMPRLKLEAEALGLGSKEFTQYTNGLRVYLGQAVLEKKQKKKEKNKIKEKLYLLSCNLDDLSAEDLAYAQELIKEHCLDLYCYPVKMKKNRVGMRLEALVKKAKKKEVEDLIFKHTSTWGICSQKLNRRKEERQSRLLKTSLGKISIKESKSKFKLEHDDLIKLAEKNKLSLSEVRNQVLLEIKNKE